MTDINSIIEMIENLKGYKGSLESIDKPSFVIRCDDIIEQLRKMSDWQPINSPEDISNELQGEPVLCFDGCDIWIDFTDYDVDTGVTYMSNGTEVTHYMPLPKPPNSKEL
jgi:hypothetical protein